MEKIITEIMSLANSCDCGNHHNQIPIETILVGNNVLGEAAAYLEKKAFKKAVIIADEQTFRAAGEELSKHLSTTKVVYSTCLLQPDENNNVVADEKSLVQAKLETSQDTEVILAVGSGTIHDIARFTSTKMKIPFISIPTAPSVDGFTSMGAPIIVRGMKKTFQMMAPIAVFADLGILRDAPKKMIAAGFGDMLAKYTSLADWKFGHLTYGEPYCPLVANITREALQLCVEKADKIAAADEEGIRILIEALIQSGLAMLLFGQSHPASGGEHHLSHYWEMEFLRQNRPQVLHGAKVGVAVALLADVYEREFIPAISVLRKLDDTIKTVEDYCIVRNIKENIEEIKAVYAAIPKASQLRELIEKVGGEILPSQLGIDGDLIMRSLTEAHHLRNRFTALKFLNEVIKVNHQEVVR
ncbi:sn-glycerol-1-phosphate dehydrogenase [Bacillus sp. AFS076308]|uniref:sn-glycerol-1-phosphate dehydrogenase n=1 Tax=unclassified Bacillus (in: firmicutes) TaxID=185979 RepID=UPI000BF375A5|nr:MULTISPECIES: sn-glycerol-1-phosphate dehydrogenase [unclassified Bacillus (in: firmicutes)]PFN97300.1 sn-glycerol-1-phosphate dehydrogenase [Bacillus sp. AFS076308]PGV51730.1 sn-glycerol-1-phosphate dehydrogenase [Bacillus sp. AFS037270]